MVQYKIWVEDKNGSIIGTKTSLPYLEMEIYKRNAEYFIQKWGLDYNVKVERVFSFV